MYTVKTSVVTQLQYTINFGENGLNVSIFIYSWKNNFQNVFR